MPSFDIVKTTIPHNSFRVASVADKYNLRAETIVECFKGALSIEDIDWNIGVIYGASGTGKSTIAREVFKGNYISEYKYGDKAIIDEMPQHCTVDEIATTFYAVGFGTVWSWLKPYTVLSTGEKMRVNLARAILERQELIVFDEYTSVVNREVARNGSFALQKAVRKFKKKFVAVSCHSDILEWLEPDWVFCTDNMKFQITRGLLRRPEIKVDVFKQKGMWELFKKYHYLNTSLNESAIQYVGYLNEIPVAFLALLHFPHPKSKKYKRVHRLVVLPDYQGLGIGYALLTNIAEIWIKQGYKYIITTSTQSLIKKLNNDSRWRLKRASRCRRISNTGTIVTLRGTMALDRYTYSYEYV